MKKIQKISDNITRITIANGDTISNFSDFIDENMMGGEELCSSPLNIINVEFEERDIYRYEVEGEPIIQVISTVDGERSSIKNMVKVLDRKGFKAHLYLDFADDEVIYGLGQDEEGVYNKRGGISYLYQHNMIIPMPFFLSNKGYGVLMNCSSLMVFDDRDGKGKITFECADQVDLFYIKGSFDEIVSAYRKLTGKASTLPNWVYGYMQCKERYITQNEVLEVAKKHRDAGVPIDCIIQDWKTWVGDLWGEKIVDKERFPNLTEMNEKLHADNIHTLVSVWPNMNGGGQNHAELAEKKMLLGDYSTYDAFRADARKTYFDQCRYELLSGGYDGWWCDNSEPFPTVDWCGQEKKDDLTRYLAVGADHEKYLTPERANAYSIYHSKGMYENQTEKPMVNLTRAGYAGIQKYGAILWAGDTSATWAELKKEIAKGLSISMCGIPYWTVDGGAFFTSHRKMDDPNSTPKWFRMGEYDDGVNDLGYQELYTRWMQFCTFLPIMRSHGTDTPREFYNFAEPFQSAIVDTIKLRYYLSPYIMDMAKRVVENDYTMMRSMMFDYSHDENVTEVCDQFMFGDDILVSPVVEPMMYAHNSAKLDEKLTHKVYLPKGNSWVDFYTKEKFDGGQYVTVDCEINKIPLFVKEGAKIPVTSGKMYIDDNKEIEIVQY